MLEYLWAVGGHTGGQYVGILLVLNKWYMLPKGNTNGD